MTGPVDLRSLSIPEEVSTPILWRLVFPDEPTPKDIVVAYASKDGFVKDVAWIRLTRVYPQTLDNPWRKAHTMHYWAWYRRAT